MCYRPITIRTHPKLETGKLPEVVTVSCGKCLECLMKASRVWSFRIIDECKLHTFNCFITLTYNEENLPKDKSVNRREVQLFIKRLRKELEPLKIRYFCCGEYGSRRNRPHYHLIIFGWFPSDVRYLKKDGCNILYRSPTIEKVWTKGFSSVGEVTLDTAKYCAKYMQKWFFDYKSDFEGLSLPFTQMSNRPGIGYGRVYNADLLCDAVYHVGKSIKIPRYYLKVMERDGLYLDDFKERRIRDGEKYSLSQNNKVREQKLIDIFLNSLHKKIT